MDSFKRDDFGGFPTTSRCSTPDLFDDKSQSFNVGEQCRSPKSSSPMNNTNIEGMPYSGSYLEKITKDVDPGKGWTSNISLDHTFDNNSDGGIKRLQELSDKDTFDYFSNLESKQDSHEKIWTDLSDEIPSNKTKKDLEIDTEIVYQKHAVESTTDSIGSEITYGFNGNNAQLHHEHTHKGFSSSSKTLSAGTISANGNDVANVKYVTVMNEYSYIPQIVTRHVQVVEPNAVVTIAVPIAPTAPSVIGTAGVNAFPAGATPKAQVGSNIDLNGQNQKLISCSYPPTPMVVSIPHSPTVSNIHQNYVVNNARPTCKREQLSSPNPRGLRSTRQKSRTKTKTTKLKLDKVKQLDDGRYHCLDAGKKLSDGTSICTNNDHKGWKVKQGWSNHYIQKHLGKGLVECQFCQSKMRSDNIKEHVRTVHKRDYYDEQDVQADTGTSMYYHCPCPPATRCSLNDRTRCYYKHLQATELRRHLKIDRHHLSKQEIANIFKKIKEKDQSIYFRNTHE